MRLKQTRSISRPWNARMSILLDMPRRVPPPPYPTEKFDPTIYYGPRATPEPGKPWWCLDFLGIQFPLHPRNRSIAEPFCPRIATGTVCFRGLPIPHMQRNRYDRPPYCNGNGALPALNCSRPRHGNGTPCNPLNPRNLLQPFEHVGLVGKRCALVS